MLLGATLLPVADVFSSETSFSCPNESEHKDKGDLYHCDSSSQLVKIEGWGLLSSPWHAVIGFIRESVMIIQTVIKNGNQDKTVCTLE